MVVFYTLCFYGAFFINSALALEPFFVKAPPKSIAENKFVYNPIEGTLGLHNPNQTSAKLIEQFGKIPNLNSEEIEVFPFEFHRDFLLVRHGYWVSLISQVKPEAIVTNLGPILPKSITFNYFVGSSNPSNIGVFIFMAKAFVHPKKEPQRLLFIISRKGKVYWIPVREDLDPSKLSFRYDDSLIIEAKIRKNATRIIHKKRSEGGDRAINETTDKTAVVEINLNSGNVILRGEENFIEPLALAATRALVGFLSSPEHIQAPARLVAAGINSPYSMNPSDLERTGNPLNSNPKKIALSIVEQNIARATERRDQVKAALEQIYGQSEAVDSLASAAAQSAFASKFEVSILAGPSGTGKTTSVHLFAKALFPYAKEPLFEFSFARQSRRDFLENTFFGSAPGYIGSETPSALMLWLLNNPNGGVLFYDEIDEAEPRAIQTLKTFLETGLIRIPPHLAKPIFERYADIPKEKWPLALQESLSDNQATPGAAAGSEIILRLTPNHFVFLATNAGSELYHGKGNSNFHARRLRTQAELTQANAQYDASFVQTSLRNKGFGDDFIRRIQSWILFKAILFEDFSKIVDVSLHKLKKKFAELKIEISMTPAFLSFLYTETYEALRAANAAEDDIQRWIGQPLLRLLEAGSKIKPGQSLTLDIEVGDKVSKQSRAKVLQGNELIYSFTIGNPLPYRPVQLLERIKAKKDFLKDRIIGHRDAIELIRDSLVYKLKQAVENPKKAGAVQLLYFDSSSGNGKTAIARATAEELFDDPNAVVFITMNNITSDYDFNRFFVEPLTAAVRSFPKGFVMVLDELPRAGGSDPHARHDIQNKLLSVLADGVLPPVAGEYRTSNGSAVRVNESTSLPPATLAIATGNLFSQLLGHDTEAMTNRELLAHFRYNQRHPEEYLAVFERAFDPALRSRMGSPILLTPLTEEWLNGLRWRFFNEELEVIRKKGIEVIVGKSVFDFLRDEHIAIRGARWPKEMIERYIIPALVRFVEDNESELLAVPEGATYDSAKPLVSISLGFDSKKRLLMASVSKQTDGSKRIHELRTIALTKSKRHPDVDKKEAWRTNIHEAAHAMVRRALYGPGSVEEINTFGGGDGGVTEFNLEVPTEAAYHSTEKGPHRLAVMLAGHIAEVLFIPDGPGEGASSDFNKARTVAERMILDGSTLSIAPLPLITNPSTGHTQMSEQTIRDLEGKQRALLRFAGEIALKIIRLNTELVKEVATALQKSADMHLSGEKFETIVGSNTRSLTTEEIRDLANADAETMAFCQSFLMRQNDSAKEWMLY